MKHLYEYTEDMERLMESDDEVSETALAEIFGDIQKKSENICHFLADLDADAAKFKAEEKRLADRRKAIEHRSAQIKSYLEYNMKRLGLDKLKAGTFIVSLVPTAGKVVIDSETQLPNAYRTIVQSITIDKTAIKDDIKRGIDVPGAHIEPDYSLRIR